ncbi:MAG: cytochrome c [Nitrospirae bacterium]|nr:cytochrome c [Nitrospirota bacterium]
MAGIRKGLGLGLLGGGLVAGVVAVSFSSVFAADLVRGKKLYDTNCIACHGSKGDGKGPAGATLNPQPTDFTSATVMKEINDARMKKSIKEGLPGTAMVSWGGILSEKDIEDVMAYVRDLLKQ